MLLDKLLSNLAVHVEPFALCLVSNGWRLRLPGPSISMMHFVLHGQGTMRCPGNTTLPLTPLSLAIVPPRIKHSLEASGKIESEQRIEGPPEGSLPVYNFVAGDPADVPELTVACGLVSVKYGQSLGLFDYLREVLVEDLSDISEVSLTFSTILSEQSSPGPGSTALVAALMTTTLVHFLRRVADRHKGLLPWLTALEDERLGRALDRILEDLAYNHTVESLAEAASMSRSSFADKFTEAFGLPPITLLHHVRMQRAAQLLHERGLSIDEVAKRVGFSSRSHFSQAFKKHCGISPTEHRAAGTM